MPARASITPETVLRDYFHAKDENRPHVLEHVFEPHAELVVVNHAETISFPAHTVGREAITDVLVRDFCRTYENIYSFYLSRPPAAAQAWSCGWLVVMSAKQGRSVRVGCGRYDWTFAQTQPPLATHLTITIRAMQLLPPDELAAVLTWAGSLDYPWCTVEEVTRASPRVASLAPVLQHLAP